MDRDLDLAEDRDRVVVLVQGLVPELALVSALDLELDLELELDWVWGGLDRCWRRAARR